MKNQQESIIAEFFKLESAGGVLLILSATMAIVFANTPLLPYYDLLLSTPVEVRVGTLEIAKPLLFG